MTNSTNTDVTFRGTWCNRMTAKQQHWHSIALADKQIKKRFSQPQTTPLLSIFFFHIIKGTNADATFEAFWG